MSMVFAALTEYAWIVFPGDRADLLSPGRQEGSQPVGVGVVGFVLPLVGLIAVLVLRPTAEAEAG